MDEWSLVSWFWSFSFLPSWTYKVTHFTTETLSPSQKTHKFFLKVFFFHVKLNVTLQVMMLTVDFSFLGSWSADRLCSAAEFPCHVRLAADMCASYSHCEDKQVGRGGHCLSATAVAVGALQFVQSVWLPLHMHGSCLCTPCCSSSMGFLSLTSHMWQETHVQGGQNTSRWQCGFCVSFLGMVSL